MSMENDIKYPYMPAGKSILYVPADNPFMVLARETAQQSNDQSIPTGAVIVADGKVISAVSNKTPLSSPWLIALHRRHCLRRLFNIPSGQKYWACPGCASHENHGEYRAVVAAMKNLPKEHKELDLYLWGHWWCCKPCWDKMLSLGIQKVYLLEGSQQLFDTNSPSNIIGRQFQA